ncbi:MerR family transcriptional regulator [Bombilactobacillus bombi]|uniref:MerR family transcriptional regulator n=2 Tax=Bombilactobacillus bombi TaxID=1303590 RepID=A0A347SUD2_9LACO|nr:MerR family transcriptional regulator [Bombilactobacillus bombi]AXX65641.1 MerR family transcriptional regulator [Bombilactobacillus bombi]MCO6541057.1 MerR family transcriptional regulator [Lactobacillus sp.]RHW51395.1 MerR family transcriptional regulator [Bombilactobacillus bombi]
MKSNLQKTFTIGEFAQLVGLSTYTLRFYEQEGLIIPKRDDANRRYYTEQDVSWLGFLLHLKGTGMTMSEMKEYVTWRAEGDQTIAKRKQLLEKVRQRANKQISDLQHNLEIVNHKIDWYDGKLQCTISDDESFAQYLQKFKKES